MQPRFGTGSDIGDRINSCVKALPKSGGTADATRFVGDFSATTPIVIPAGTRLLLGAVTIRLSRGICVGTDSEIDGVGVDTVLIASQFPKQDIAVISNCNQTKGNKRIRIKKLKVDANKSSNPSAVLIDGVYFIKCDDCVIEDLVVSNAKSLAAAANIRMELGHRNRVSNVVVTGSDAMGISFANESYSVLVNSRAYQNFGNGIDINASPHSSILGNWSVLTGPGSMEQRGMVIVAGSDGSIVAGNHLIRNRMEGIVLQNVRDVIVSGNEILDNNTANIEGLPGLSIQADGANPGGGNTGSLTIVNNTILNKTVGHQKFAISQAGLNGGTIGANTISFNMIEGTEVRSYNYISQKDLMVCNHEGGTVDECDGETKIFLNNTLPALVK
jgi:parallel beta-helix repeat protein